MESLTTNKLEQVAKRIILAAILLSVAVATVGCGSSPVAVPKHMSIGSGHYTEYGIWVELKPTELAVANESYLVDLYEDGQPRATAVVTWNQLELDVLKTKTVLFPATKAEFDAYHRHDISDIFKVNVQSTPVTVPNAYLISCSASLYPTTPRIYISGSVTNDSKWPIGYVRVVIEFLDQNHKVIKHVYIPVSPSIISPGGSGSFDTSEVFTSAYAYSSEYWQCEPVWEWIPPQPSS